MRTIPLSRRIAISDRQLLLKVAILLFLIALFLLGSRLPAEYDKISVIQSGTWRPRGAVPISFSDRWQVPDDASFVTTVLLSALNFWRANIMGMTFGLALGGAALSLLGSAPAADRALARRGFTGTLLGMLLGAPLNLCVNCASVTSAGACRRVGAPEAAYGIVLGSALWNIIGLSTIGTLFPRPVFIARLVFGIVMTTLALPLLCRWLLPIVPSDDQVVEPAEPVGWRDGATAALHDWWESCALLAVRLLPLMVGATLLAALTRVMIQPLFGPFSGDTPISILALTLAGSLVSVPVLFEIPLAMIVAQLGAGVGGIAAVLCTAPSIGVFTVPLMARMGGWRLALALLVVTFILGAGAGALAHGLAVMGV